MSLKVLKVLKVPITELFASAGLICLTAFVSPYRIERDRVRNWVKSKGAKGDFLEVFVNTPLAVCIARDPKGLYQQAIQGKIPNFTGISIGTKRLNPPT